METIKGELSEKCLDDLVEAALRTGSAELVDRLEAMGGNVIDEGIGRLVTSAARSGSVDRLAWLERRGLAIAPHAQGALHSAIVSGSVAMVESLVKYGASLKGRDASKYFRAAFMGSNVAMLQFLMEHFPGHKVDYKKCLMAAAAKNSVEMIDFIRSKSFPLAKHAGKAVLKAAEGGHIEMIRYLISIGADIAEDGNAVLYSAINSGNGEVVRLLLAYNGGAYFDALTLALSAVMDRAILSPAWSGHLLKLAKDVPINLQSLLVKARRNSYGKHYMRMILAYVKAEDRQRAATDTLVAAALQPNSTTNSNISFLLRQGADVAAYKNQAAFNAASTGNPDALRLLLDRSASIRERANEAAIVAASKRGSVKRLNFLFLNGAAIDICGAAALQAATDNKQRSAILFLQERMASATLPNN